MGFELSLVDRAPSGILYCIILIILFSDYTVFCLYLQECSSAISLGHHYPEEDTFIITWSIQQWHHSFERISVRDYSFSPVSDPVFYITTFKQPPGTACCTTTTAPQALSDTTESIGLEKWLKEHKSHVYALCGGRFYWWLLEVSANTNAALLLTKRLPVQRMFYNSVWGWQRKRCASGQKVLTHWVSSRDRTAYSHDQTNWMKPRVNLYKQINKSLSISGSGTLLHKSFLYLKMILAFEVKCCVSLWFIPTISLN